LLQTFTKRTETLNWGMAFEDMNLVSLTLNLTFDNAVQDFVLSSYDSKFGAFGDIVCEVEASQENSKYAIQLKHVKDEQKKKIKVTDLENKCGKFSLLTFFEQYQEVKDVCEPYDIILHTNQKLDFNAEEEKIVFKHGTNTINVVMTKCDAHPWLSTNTNKSYKFKIIENQSKTNMKKYGKFFGKFYLYVEQMNVRQLEEHILDKFKNEFCCENDHALKKYLHFIKSWKNRDGKKKKLSKTVMKNVLLLNLLSEKIRLPMFSKEPLSAEIRQLREKILKYDVTILGTEKEDLIKRIWRFNSNELLNDAQAQELVVDYQLTFNDQTVLKLQWMMDRCPLLVVDSDVTRKAINLSTSKKFVLFSDNDNIDDFTNLSVLRKLSDLEEYPEIYKTVVDKFRCAIQLKTNAFPLKTFLEGNKEIQDIVTTDKLVSMIDGPLVTCVDNEVFLPLYIPRHIWRNIIDLEETVVDKFTCAIQLKTKAFRLRKFLQENKNVQEIFTTDKLVSMIDGPLVICADNEVLSPLYIPRHISRNIIDLEETVVDKFTCATQLKTNAFPLITFLEGNKEIQDIVTTNQLVYMIDSQSKCERYSGRKLVDSLCLLVVYFFCLIWITFRTIFSKKKKTRNEFDLT
jgi:negative regulator of replication initiation